MRKEKPIKGGMKTCSHCGIVEEILSLDTPIVAGFGEAKIMKDDIVVYNEAPNTDFFDAPLLSSFEKLAKKEPDKDWRYILNLPLRSAVYQRHDNDTWVLIEKGIGFA